MVWQVHYTRLLISAFYVRVFLLGEKSIASAILRCWQPPTFTVGCFLFLPTYWWQVLAKLDTDRKVQKYSFCAWRFATANVMFAYFEIKNQYTIIHQEKLFLSICRGRVMDFLISSRLSPGEAVVWAAQGMQLSTGSRRCMALLQAIGTLVLGVFLL